MRPSRLLAATDFSDSSRIALDFAVRLARHTGAELHVMHAQDPLLAGAAAREGIDVMAETRDELQRFAEGVTGTPTDGRPLRIHAVVGAAVATTLAVAARERIDLLVLGAHGISGAERLIFGSTTEGVLRKSKVPVFVVPDTWVPPAPSSGNLSGAGPIMVGVDLSDASAVAVQAAAQLAVLLDTHVVLLHVVPELRVLERWRSSAAATIEARAAAAKATLDALAATVSTGRTEVRVESGHVGEQIANIAQHHRNGLLVLGRANPAEGGAPGAIAYRVLTLARVPVLMHVAT